MLTTTALDWPAKQHYFHSKVKFTLDIPAASPSLRIRRFVSTNNLSSITLIIHDERCQRRPYIKENIVKVTKQKQQQNDSNSQSKVRSFYEVIGYTAAVYAMTDIAYTAAVIYECGYITSYIYVLCLLMIIPHPNPTFQLGSQ